MFVHLKKKEKEKEQQRAGHVQPALDPQHRLLWDLLLRVILWNIWLERSNQIFKLQAYTSHYVISKIIHMLLVWISATRDPSQHFLSDSL